MIDLWPITEKMPEVKKCLYDTIAEAKQERTCLKYELCENLNQEGQLTLLQAWSTEEALQKHLTSDLINKTTELIRPLLQKPTEIRRYRNIG